MYTGKKKIKKMIKIANINLILFTILNLELGFRLAQETTLKEVINEKLEKKEKKNPPRKRKQ